MRLLTILTIISFVAFQDRGCQVRLFECQELTAKTSLTSQQQHPGSDRVLERRMYPPNSRLSDSALSVSIGNCVANKFLQDGTPVSILG